MFVVDLFATSYPRAAGNIVIGAERAAPSRLLAWSETL